MAASFQGRGGRRVGAADLLRYRAKFLTVAWRSVLLPADALDLPHLHPIHACCSKESAPEPPAAGCASILIRSPYGGEERR